TTPGRHCRTADRCRFSRPGRRAMSSVTCRRCSSPGPKTETGPHPVRPTETSGPRPRRRSKAFRNGGQVDVDGIVGDKTWAVPLHAANSTLETAVGLAWAED